MNDQIDWESHSKVILFPLAAELSSQICLRLPGWLKSIPRSYWAPKVKYLKWEIRNWGRRTDSA
jgi:hypothetical protein